MPVLQTLAFFVPNLVPLLVVIPYYICSTDVDITMHRTSDAKVDPLSTAATRALRKIPSNPGTPLTRQALPISSYKPRDPPLRHLKECVAKLPDLTWYCVLRHDDRFSGREDSRRQRDIFCSARDLRRKFDDHLAKTPGLYPHQQTCTNAPPRVGSIPSPGKQRNSAGAYIWNRFFSRWVF